MLELVKHLLEKILQKYFQRWTAKHEQKARWESSNYRYLEFVPAMRMVFVVCIVFFLILAVAAYYDAHVSGREPYVFLAFLPFVALGAYGLYLSYQDIKFNDAGFIVERKGREVLSAPWSLVTDFSYRSIQEVYRITLSDGRKAKISKYHRGHGEFFKLLWLKRGEHFMSLFEQDKNKGRLMMLLLFSPYDEHRQLVRSLASNKSVPAAVRMAAEDSLKHFKQ